MCETFNLVLIQHTAHKGTIKCFYFLRYLIRVNDIMIFFFYPDLLIYAKIHKNAPHTCINLTLDKHVVNFRFYLFIGGGGHKILVQVVKKIYL